MMCNDDEMGRAIASVRADRKVIISKPDDLIKEARSEAKADAFKEGMEYGNQKSYDIGVCDGKVDGVAEGIREVVEWINKELILCGSGVDSREKWEAKRKEWGIGELPK